MDQTKLESGIETCCNVGSGFILAYFVWAWVVVPLIENGFLTIESTFAITSIFTVVSLVRGYGWRRFFANGVHKKIHVFATYLYQFKTQIQNKVQLSLTYLNKLKNLVRGTNEKQS